VRLIGFAGSEAELKTTKAQREYAVLSLATTASWKDKNGDGYIRRTEWHKLVAWAPQRHPPPSHSHGGDAGWRSSVRCCVERRSRYLTSCACNRAGKKSDIQAMRQMNAISAPWVMPILLRKNAGGTSLRTV
jgi:hypothetical protein